jgi:hypothetical protein
VVRVIGGDFLTCAEGELLVSLLYESGGVDGSKCAVPNATLQRK